jgi:phage tail tape-measure protein
MNWTGLLRRLATKPVVIVGAASMGYRVTKDYRRFSKGEIDAPELRARTGQHAGSISGGFAGAAVGAAAGSVVPVVGTLLGGFAGGLLGEAGGSRLGRAVVEKVESLVAKTDA